MSTTLPLYWNLSSAVKKERIDASVKLVGALQQFQAQYTPPAVFNNENASSSESEDDDEGAEEGAAKPKKIINEVDELNAEDVRYAIRRLGRGLASPRESSRLGFAVALTELLSRLDTVSSAQIVPLVLNSTELSGSMKGHEERDQFFARLFGLTSVVQSGLLFRNATLPTSNSSRTLTSTIADFQTVSTELIALGNKKSWLRESCWWSLCLAVDGLHASAVSWKTDALVWLANQVFGENKEWSPEKLGLALRLQGIAPTLPWKKLLSPTFKDGHVLSSGSLPIVSRILREGPSEVDASDSQNQNKKSGTWKPQLHFAWDIIFQQYFPTLGQSSSNNLGSSFQDFFRIAVDESLFSASSSPERKSWGFRVFEKSLNSVPSNEIAFLFTKNFMRTWINHLSGHDRLLHKAARQVATEVQSIVDKHPTIGFTLVLQLVGGHGNRQFDKITKTKTVESIIASTNVEGIEQYIEFVMKQINQADPAEDADVKSIDARRLWAIDQLNTLVRNGAVLKDDKWLGSVLGFFVLHGFFKIVKKNAKSPVSSLHAIPSPEFSESLKRTCRQHLFSSLADLTSQSSVIKGEDGKISKASASAADGELWVSKALNIITTLQADTKHVQPLVESSPELAALRDEAVVVRESLKRVTENRRDIAEGAELLLHSLILQSYDPDLDVGDTLQESLASIKRLVAPTEKKKKQKKRKSVSAAEDVNMDTDVSKETAPIDEIADTLIGFLEESTAYARIIATTVFSFMTAEVGENTLDLILAQLEKRDVEEDGSDDEHDHSGDDSDDSDSHDDDGSSDKSDQSDEDDDADPSDGEDEDLDGDVDPELRRKIAEALQISENADDGSDEEMFDDDQMLQMDDKLAEVFRMQQGPKVDKKHAAGVQREATHFKIRVLDLVDMYVRKQPKSEHIVRLVWPLIEAIRGARADEEQFANKTTSVLSSRICKLKELPDPAKVDTEAATMGLKSIHEIARKAPTPGFISILSQASVYLSRVLAHQGSDAAVLEVYRGSLEDFITRKNSQLNAKFFEDFIKRQAPTAWKMRTDIVGMCAPNKAVNAFRTTQAYQLLQSLLTSAQSIPENSIEILAFLPACREAVYAIIANASKDDGLAINVAQLKQIIKFALQGARISKRIEADSIESVWDADTLTKLTEGIQASDRFKGSPAVHSLLRQLLEVIRPTKGDVGKSQKGKTGTKRKLDERGGEGGGGEVAEVKRKKKPLKK